MFYFLKLKTLIRIYKENESLSSSIELCEMLISCFSTWDDLTAIYSIFWTCSFPGFFEHAYFQHLNKYKWHSRFIFLVAFMAWKSYISTSSPGSTQGRRVLRGQVGALIVFTDIILPRPSQWLRQELIAMIPLSACFNNRDQQLMLISQL